MLIVLFPFPFTAYQGHRESEVSIFDPRSVIRLNNPLDLLNARSTERLTGGDGSVEYVSIKPVLGGKRGFGGCVEEEVAGAAADDTSMSIRKGVSM